MSINHTVKARLALAYRIGAWGALCLLIPLNIWAFVVYRQESAEVRKIARERSAGCQTPSEEMRALLHFVAFDVPSKNTDKFFLLPMFRCLRPTPLQIIQNGGDCSYKGRALVALLRARGVRATKCSLHTPDGLGVHAVVSVKTEKGDYIADALFGFAMEHEDGSPIPIDELVESPELVQSVIARETAGGNPKTARYPIQKYVYTDVRSYNLEQYSFTAAVRRGLVTIFGKKAIDRFPRLNLFTEPALIVMWSSAAATIGLLAPLSIARACGARQREQAAAAVETDLTDVHSHVRS